MKPIHYNHSYITGTWSENRVRFWVESRLRYINERTGVAEDFYQCASCKSEDTFAEQDLFFGDNYDFTPIFGPVHGLIFRRYAYLNDNYRTCKKADEMWGGQIYRIDENQPYELLESNEQIRAATHAGWPLVAQTELWNSDLGLRAILEYPVKTMNIHDEKNMYQVDTGPVLFPDLSQPVERPADAVRLAYVAFNVAHFADFVIEQPTPIPDSRVYHYSGPVSLEAGNRLYALNVGRPD